MQYIYLLEIIRMKSHRAPALINRVLEMQYAQQCS
jgi:hypothetical protein